MKAGAGALLALLAAACSDGGGGAERAAEAPAAAATDAPPAAEVSAPSSPGRLAQGGRSLSGSVSGLSGDIRGFQVEVTETATIVELAADVLFAFDSDRLSVDAPEQLARTAELIRQGAPGTVTVIGHTDNKGEDAYNDDLSLRRARAVAGWLETSGGIERGRLQPEGRGEREPAVPNARPDGSDDPDGRARNRRVVVAIPRP